MDEQNVEIVMIFAVYKKCIKFILAGKVILNFNGYVYNAPFVLFSLKHFVLLFGKYNLILE